MGRWEAKFLSPLGELAQVQVSKNKPELEHT